MKPASYPCFDILTNKKWRPDFALLLTEDNFQEVMRSVTKGVGKMRTKQL